MQFYALDGEIPVLAAQALRHKDYLCPECQAFVRLRKGSERQPHFYHPTVPAHCQQHKKSLTHLRIQWIIQSLLPSGEGKMERAFPEIGRIADVAWESAKIVFEIQFSPISLREANARCQDYRSLGFTPIWILHEKQFNKRKIRASEDLLRQIGGYYTNIDEKGHGEIYDQFDICRRGRRFFKGPPLKVDITRPMRMLAQLDNSPQLLVKRTESWPLYFSGDLFDSFLQRPSSSMHEMENNFLKPRFSRTFWQAVKQFYQIFFRMALERVCR